MRGLYVTRTASYENDRKQFLSKGFGLHGPPGTVVNSPPFQVIVFLLRERSTPCWQGNQRSYAFVAGICPLHKDHCLIGLRDSDEVALLTWTRRDTGYVDGFLSPG